MSHHAREVPVRVMPHGAAADRQRRPSVAVARHEPEVIHAALRDCNLYTKHDISLIARVRIK